MPNLTCNDRGTEPADPVPTAGTYTMMGRRWNTLVFKTDDAANAFMEQAPDYALLADHPGEKHVALKDDMGTKA